MARYMLSCADISDPETEDGTTGLTMALARDDTDLVEALLKSTLRRWKTIWESLWLKKLDVALGEGLVEVNRAMIIAIDALSELETGSKMKNVLNSMLLEHFRNDEIDHVRRKLEGAISVLEDNGGAKLNEVRQKLGEVLSKHDGMQQGSDVPDAQNPISKK